MNGTPNAAQPLAIDFERHPLVPTVIVDHASGAVLMIGFMNEEAYRKTRETGRTHFWSRSRNTLWQKGETSGHEQIVQKMSINCEDNALLISVEQIGAVCHTGHPTCFFRDIEEDGSLTTTTDRLFDPDVVYGGRQDSTMLWYGALEWLKSSDLSDSSTTSRLLHTPEFAFARRVGEELQELAGVLDGTHAHRGLPDDLLIEGSQALYWLALSGIAQELTWDDIRPDRALDTTADDVSPNTAAALISAAANEWSSESAPAVRIHESMALVAQAAASLGVKPLELVDHDLNEMRGRDYLRAYFENQES